MIETIQEMEHHIRTAFGESEVHHGNQPEDLPAQGILQGNGAGPSGWSSTSAILIKTMKAQGFGHEEWTLIRQRAMAMTCFAFVDDTDLIRAAQDPAKPLQELLEEAQQASFLWENLLRVTGGALAPKKSHWCLVEVVWKNDECQCASTDDRPGQLFLNGGNRVQRHSPHEAKEALGIQIRPDGGMTDKNNVSLKRQSNGQTRFAPKNSPDRKHGIVSTPPQ